MSQFTIALLKPDLAVNPLLVRAVLDHIARKRMSIIAHKTMLLSRGDSEEFYKQHRGRFFYRRLVEFTSSGPMVALLLSGKDSICEWRTLMGPTKTFKAAHSHPNSLRAQFGLTDTRNSTHGADTREAVSEECTLLFGKTIEDLTNDTTAASTFNFGDLAKPCYWNSLYNNSNIAESCSEWFVNYERIQGYILPVIQDVLQHQKSASQPAVILDVGCGVSVVGPHIARKFNKAVHVYCIDFALEALLKLRMEIDNDSEFDDLTNCFLIRSDMTKELPFEPNSIVTIIDKGCIDSILRQNGGHQKAVNAICNNLRLLCQGGVFLQVSDEPPDLRLDLLNDVTNICHFACDINCQELLCNLETDRTFFFYTIKKL